MDTPDHNNAKPAEPPVSERRQLQTLEDLIQFVAGLPSVPVSRKRYLLSALRRARQLLRNGAAEVRADLKFVLQQLERLSPAMAGMTPQSFANLRSRVRSAFRLAIPGWRRRDRVRVSMANGRRLLRALAFEAGTFPGSSSLPR